MKKRKTTAEANRLWNEAVDRSIEAILRESGIKLPEMTTEEIYKALTEGETK